MFSTPGHGGNTGILVSAPALGRIGFYKHLWMPQRQDSQHHTGNWTLVLAGKWWELPAAMATFLELKKLKEMGKRKKRTMGRNRER